MTKITQSIIAGSALSTNLNADATAALSYNWMDDTALPGADYKYWLVDYDLDGKQTWHGPVSPSPASGQPPKYARSVLLSRLGAASPTHSLSSTIVSNNEPSLLSEAHAPIVMAASSQSNSSKQFELAAQASAKIIISKDGWYRVTQPQLAAAGFDTGNKPSRLQLYHNGVEVPIIVNTVGDTALRSTDSIEFYGAITNTPYSNTDVYWLVNGTASGSRLSSPTKSPSFPSKVFTKTGFPYTIEQKDRTIYFAALVNGEADNFFGQMIYTDPVQSTVFLQHIDRQTNGNGTLEVAVQGVTDLPDVYPDHNIQIMLNGRPIGSLSFDGRALGVNNYSIPQSWLNEGLNTLTFSSTGGEQDISLLDYVRITYSHTYEPDGGSLVLPIQGGQSVTIQGLSPSQTKAVDITNLNSLQLITLQSSTDKYASAITFIAPGLGNRTIFITNQALQPSEIKINSPSTWHDMKNSADYVLITNQKFIRSFDQLLAFRNAQGFSTALVDIEDIYDEFNYGVKSPQAIKDFLSNASQSWRKPPRYIVLAGDATFDPRNYLGIGDFDYVPTKIVDTAILETASDDWFADFNQDGIADIPIGRLAVRTAREASTIASKIVAYEQASPAGQWTSQILLVADLPDESSDFDAYTADIATTIPSNYSVIKILTSQVGPAAARQAILDGINSGKLIVNYAGHGSTCIWSSNYLLTSDDAKLLSNSGRTPFFVMMTCFNGLFQDIYTESISEALLKAENGGAIAVLASSSTSEPDSFKAVNQSLFQTILNDHSMTLGEAALKAKGSLSDPSLRRTWVYFGDPATRLKVK